MPPSQSDGASRLLTSALGPSGEREAGAGIRRGRGVMNRLATVRRSRVTGRRAPLHGAVALATVLSMAGVVAVTGASPAFASSATVQNCNGSGSGSLAATVASAPAGATITFSVTCPSGSPITLSETIAVTKNLTIDGPGPTRMYLSGDNRVEVLDVSATVSISGVTVEDGAASGAGGG